MNTITKFMAAIIFSILLFSFPQKLLAATMKSTDWPDAGVVWTTAEPTNYWGEIYSTNFPYWPDSAASYNSIPILDFQEKLPVKEIKLLKRDKKRLAKIQKRKHGNTVMAGSSFNPGWPTEYGPYYSVYITNDYDRSGYAYKDKYTYSTVTPAGMYTDGENYFIVYNVLSKNYSYESMRGYYDIKSTGAYDNDYKSIRWYKEKITHASQAYVQKIDKNGNVISDMGLPITSGDDYENYYLTYYRVHITETGGWNYIHNEWTNYISGSVGGASLVDCGKNLLISGQRVKPGYWYWDSTTDYWVNAEVDGGIYYVTASNTLEKLDWPSWCSGKFVGLSSGHKTSGRENKYIHAFGGVGGKRVWRLLPR